MTTTEHDNDDAFLLRYSRHILLDEIGIEGQQKLSAAHILVVGCGGLGAAALPYLAASGIGTLTIADSDTVELHNLQRQVAFDEGDVGKLKTEAWQTVCAISTILSMSAPSTKNLTAAA